jgi:hypothetical protein
MAPKGDAIDSLEMGAMMGWRNGKGVRLVARRRNRAVRAADELDAGGVRASTRRCPRSILIPVKSPSWCAAFHFGKSWFIGSLFDAYLPDVAGIGNSAGAPRI